MTIRNDNTCTVCGLRFAIHDIGTDGDLTDCSLVHHADGSTTPAAEWHALEAAKRDAVLFADEFPGEMLDPATTDWDSVAWDMEICVAPLANITLSDWQKDALRETYATCLREETARLAHRD